MAKAIAIKSQHFAPDHPTFAIRWWNLAIIDHAEGKKAEACANLRRALKIATTHFDENHPHVIGIRSWMQRAGCTP